VVLERNPDYREQGKPYLDGIEMTIAADDTARSATVRTGTIDFVEYAPLKDIPNLKSDSSLVLVGGQNIRGTGGFSPAAAWTGWCGCGRQGAAPACAAERSSL